MLQSEFTLICSIVNKLGFIFSFKHLAGEFKHVRDALWETGDDKNGEDGEDEELQQWGVVLAPVQTIAHLYDVEVQSEEVTQTNFVSIITDRQFPAIPSVSAGFCL